MSQTVRSAVTTGWERVKRLASARVSEHEGGYDSLNANTDGAGLSVGKKQWAQRPGALAVLARAWAVRDPEGMVRILGPSASDVILVLSAPTTTGRMAPVDGALLWQEPWLSRWRAAGRDPVFQAVQDELSLNGPEMVNALKVRDLLGLRTERGFTIALDRSVQQGPSAPKYAQQMVDADPSVRSLPERERIAAFVERCIGRFRRSSQPTDNAERWRRVGNEWHYFAGSVDVYAAALRRSVALLDDPNLSDFPVADDGAVA